MITTTILAIVESFLADIAYAVLFNVPSNIIQHVELPVWHGCFVSGKCQVTTVHWRPL